MDKGKSIITEVEGDDERKIDLPPGYRFVPTDTELVVHYLFNKVSHKPLPGNMIITINIYDFHPQQLARYKMSLDFYEGGPRDGRKTEWKMHEYKILPTRKSNAADSMKLDDLVLCKIYSTSKKAKDVQENKRTELAAENANQDSRPLGVSNGMNMETPGSLNLLQPNSEWDRFLSKPLEAHHMPLVEPSMSFQELSRVQIQNPSMLSGGDNDQLFDLMYLDGLINGSSHDNCPSSLGAHMMHTEE
ncbi:NAC domain-containing protein 1-like [Actinidia eriantha]|uniref:NAC domain-containing protein 1-like n=1 Tax=Actinidia eriantha TaxID=165200 RepID=UPI0025825A93|nr:NAC domain-containing protein 1-like [Actinidia eriantha]